jgi:hypothetical protein
LVLLIRAHISEYDLGMADSSGPICDDCHVSAVGNERHLDDADESKRAISTTWTAEGHLSARCDERRCHTVSQTRGEPFDIDLRKANTPARPDRTGRANSVIIHVDAEVGDSEDRASNRESEIEL